LVVDENIEARLRGAEQSIATLFERQAQRDVAINDKLDSVIAAVKDEHGTVLTRQDTTNGEVAKLKAWQQRIIGATGAIVFVIGVFGVWVLSELI
jgi:low affinity Fe/Cu permease